MSTIVHGDQTRGDDNAILILEFEGGVDRDRRGELDQARRHGRPRRGLRLAGRRLRRPAARQRDRDLQRGAATTTRSRRRARRRAGASRSTRRPGTTASTRDGALRRLRARTTAQPLVTGEDGRAVLEVVFAAYESARTRAQGGAAVREHGAEAHRPVVGRSRHRRIAARDRARRSSMAGQGLERREVLRIMALAAAASGFPGFARWTFRLRARRAGPVAGAAGDLHAAVLLRRTNTRRSSAWPSSSSPATTAPGAREAGVSEFVDFMVASDPESSTAFRYGLTWLDAHARPLHGGTFRALDAPQQEELLGPLAYKARHRPGEEEGRAFFKLLRELHAHGLLHVQGRPAAARLSGPAQPLPELAGLPASRRPRTPASAGAEGLRDTLMADRDLRRDRDRHRRRRRHGHQDAVRGRPLRVRPELRPPPRSGQGLPEPQAALRHALPRASAIRGSATTTTTSRTNTATACGSTASPTRPRPGTSWEWPRCHAVGGKTNFWGRSAARMGDIDFKTASVDGGYDVDWPVTYDEIAPYYSRVERMIGVASTVQGRPSNPDGEYLPPMPLRCLDHILKAGCDKIGRPVPAGPPGPAHRAPRGPSAVPLLRQLHRGLRHRIVLLDPVVPAARGGEDGQARAAHERGGPRHRSSTTTGARRAWPTSIATRSRRSRSTRRRSWWRPPAWSPRASC